MQTSRSRPKARRPDMTRRAALGGALLGALAAPGVAKASIRSLDEDTAKRIMAVPWAVAGPRASPPAIHALVTNTCPYSRAFMRDVYPGLVRSRPTGLLLAAVEGESTTAVAGAALRRDASVIESVFAGRRPAERDLSDEEWDAYDRAVQGTVLIRDASVRAGFAAFIPSFVWRRSDGQWRISSGYSPQVWAPIASELAA